MRELMDKVLQTQDEMRRFLSGTGWKYSYSKDSVNNLWVKDDDEVRYTTYAAVDLEHTRMKDVPVYVMSSYLSRNGWTESYVEDGDFSSWIPPDDPKHGYELDYAYTIQYRRDTERKIRGLGWQRVISPDDEIGLWDHENVKIPLLASQAIKLVEESSVNHPDHYGGDTTYETIKVIENWGLNFHLGNALKYISRADKKGVYTENLDKAIWYLQREKERFLNGSH